jgi:ubiquinone/menaquinone biosynthesis C-methylase UbiE
LPKTAAQLHENVPPGWYFHSIQENSLQRYWHSRRFMEVGKLIEPVKGKVLDIGSSDGVFSKVILDKSQAKELTGIDVLDSSVNWANKHWRKNKKMRFLVADAHNLPFKAGTFEAAFIMEVLEHVYNPEKVLRETKRVLKKGGYAVFLVPSDNLLFRATWFLWGFYRGKIWSHTHIQTYRDNYLPKLAKKVGYKIEEDKKFILGMLHVVKVRKS